MGLGPAWSLNSEAIRGHEGNPRRRFQSRRLVDISHQGVHAVEPRHIQPVRINAVLVYVPRPDRSHQHPDVGVCSPDHLDAVIGVKDWLAVAVEDAGYDSGVTGRSGAIAF